MKNNLPLQSNDCEVNKIPIDLVSLKSELSSLREIINGFEDSTETLGWELNEDISNLSNKKGSFLGISFSKDPTPKELLDTSRKIVNKTNQNFIAIDDKIADLNKTDKKIFELLCILAGLSGMTYKRIGDAFSVIDDAQKEIDNHCDVTTEQGKRIKQIALMHLQRIKEDKERYERIDSFVKQYTSKIDSLAEKLGSLDNYIDSKTIEIAQLYSESKSTFVDETNRIFQNIKEKLAVVEKEHQEIIDKKLESTGSMIEKYNKATTELIYKSDEANKQAKEVLNRLSEKENRFNESTTQAIETLNKEAEGHNDRIKETAQAEIKDLDVYLTQYEETLAASYRKKLYWGVMGSIIVSTIVSIIINMIL